MTETNKAVAFGQSIAARLRELAAVSDTAGGITRFYLSPAHRRAADLVAGWMREAGMTVRVTDLGDVIGRYEGAMTDAPALWLGSHIDSVANAGAYDGTLGVVTAIAIVADLHKAETRLPFAVEVIAFGDEEGRFPTTLTGSRALTGRFDPAWLDERDAQGVSRRDALKAFGCDPGRIVATRPDPNAVLGYIEVHIEQGPVLEAENLPLAAVTAINGASRGSITITGMSGHAGTVPMAMRQDTLAASAEMILAVEACGKATPDLVATVGRIVVANAAVNTVAGETTISLDVRAPADAVRKKAVADIEATCRAIATRRGVGMRMEMPYDAPAAACDPRLVGVLEKAITKAGAPPRRMGSGAGHDAMSFKDVAPFAMLFVRCKGGISHNPAEFASEADIGAAALALRFALDGLAAP